MLVNIGGDPDRDDYGLPWVDIEIPDDARELDRDVLTYHRELRALRRKLLARRVRGPLSHDGMVLPLLASCLALTLLAGTLLTMFAARRTAPPGQAASTRSSATPSVGQVGGLLPDIKASVGGSPEQLRDLGSPSVLALIPPSCRCGTALQRLSVQADTADVPIYYVGGSGELPQVKALTAQIGRGSIQVIEDPGDTIGATYQRAGLTAVLVGNDGSVRIVQRNVGPAVQLKESLQALVFDDPQGLERPGNVLLGSAVGLGAA
jgi:hypothetical protein